MQLKTNTISFLGVKAEKKDSGDILSGLENSS